MAGAQTPLQREVSESMNTSEAIRAETLRILEQSNEMLRMAEEKGADTTEIRKRLEAVRQTTIYALKDIVVSSNNDRAKITEELSDGKIDGSEIENIKEEYNELKGENDRLMASLDLKKLIDIHIRD